MSSGRLVKAILVIAVPFCAACGGGTGTGTGSSGGSGSGSTGATSSGSASSGSSGGSGSGSTGATSSGSASLTGAQSAVVNSGSTVFLSPSQIYVQRSPATCGVVNPPFTDGDLFSLDAVGTSTTTAPWTGIAFDCSRSVAMNLPIALVLGAYQSFPPSGRLEQYAEQRASSPTDSAIQFDFTWGSELSEVDASPLGAATVTVLAFPEQDGDPLTVRFQLHFQDVQSLDETFSGPLVSSYGGCPRP